MAILRLVDVPCISRCLQASCLCPAGVAFSWAADLRAPCNTPLQIVITTDGCTEDSTTRNYCDAGSPVGGTLSTLKPESNWRRFVAWLGKSTCTNKGSAIADMFADVAAFNAKFALDLDVALSRALPPYNTHLHCRCY